MSSDAEQRSQEIIARLKEIDIERNTLLKELAGLRKAEKKPSTEISLRGLPASLTPLTSSEERLALFQKLFCCRTDVFPKLWQNSKTGAKGYSPACKNEWARDVCLKPKTKCADCLNRSFIPLDESVIRNHLEGAIIIGTYAIRLDDTCIFLAADFDEERWMDDIRAYQLAAKELGIEVYIERSRSGNGGHAWIFFAEPVQARDARLLGTHILSRAMSNRFSLSMKSYDRFFPCQDTIPSKGFGNLIALPLQRTPRRNGNSVFVNERFEPYDDQWKLLGSVRLLSPFDLQEMLQSFSASEVVKIDSSEADNTESILAERALGKTDQIAGIYKGTIRLIYSRNIQIDISGLPSRLIAALKKLATFANPEFFEAQRMRRSTWDIPRYICCAELEGTHICLPRGQLNTCRELLEKAGASVIVSDNRKTCYAQILFSFSGELKPEQNKGFDALLSAGSGVLVAPPGSGKTVIGCALIGERKLPTLILVHRKQLADQWKSQLVNFLGMRKKDVGLFSTNLNQRKGIVDIGMIQTVSKLVNHDEILSDYGMVIVDECHHIPAPSFEPALKSISALHFIGLTATPYRKDGLQSIIHMQCGPIVFTMSENQGQAEITRKAIIRETCFRMPADSPPQAPIHEVWSNLVKNAERNQQLANDVAMALKEGRFPLVLSDRKDHLDLLLVEIQKACINVGVEGKGFILTSDIGKKERKRILLEISSMREKKERPLLLSTGSLIGEGFDLPALSTLILAMPISFKGRLIQYAGRLHRESEEKTEALVYDYVDANLGLGISMFRKRLTAYKKMGYQIDVAEDSKVFEIVYKRRRKMPQNLPIPTQIPSGS